MEFLNKYKEKVLSREQKTFRKLRHFHSMHKKVKVNWFLTVTINYISVIHVTAQRCAGGTEEEVRPTVGLPCHTHFVGFFNVPVLAPTRDHPFFTGDFDTPPNLVALYDHAGDTVDTFST